MDKTVTGTYRFTIRTRDIQTFASKQMGIELTQHQLWMIDQWAAGKMLLLAKRSGVTTARQVLKAFVDQDDGYIKHFDKTHFTAVTIGGRKFLYCPVGNICSWSEGDYDHKWCEWCKKHFEEIQRG